MQLTPEQQQIVLHHQGPAIVYAVAGAGKSTTMAHRVRHLVQVHGVQPARILVCSFSRETVGDIRRKIETLGVSGVQCLTFNALGRRLVLRAVEQGHWPAFDENDIDQRSSQLAMRTLIEMSRRHGRNFSGLNLNVEDLQTYISVCKGNLRYADLSRAHLPIEALQQATQAEHENRHYLEAYQLYEELRRQANALTFDDQLLLGWEALLRFADVRAWANSSYDYLLIDEFQDVNRVQAQLADIFSERHRNYMAIGDDDQCIYEWRGADVRYILDFRKTYQAREYVISDNFRCPAEAALLAGKVIACNRERHVKELVASKGFGGTVQLRGFGGEMTLAAALVAEYRAWLAAGGTPEQAIVLVRSYAQTAAIEARLIHEGLPYRVIGSQRFYERPEVKVLFTYLSFARQERDLLQAGTAPGEQYLRRFADIIRTPNRYLTSDWIAQVRDAAWLQQQSVLNLLESGQHPPLNEMTRKRVWRFVQVLRGLQQRLEQPAADTLVWLIAELDYLDELKKQAGIAEMGEERAKNVRALVTYAAGKGSVLDFLRHLGKLHQEELDADKSLPRLQLMSIHRAKGLEWPLVFVPCCGDDQLPASNDNLEEERRLLYVALTRCKQSLYLYYTPDDKPSRFLREVRAPEIVTQSEMIRNTLARPASSLRAEDAINLAVSLRLYPLLRYYRDWWRPDRDSITAWQRSAHEALARQDSARQQLASVQQVSAQQQQQRDTQQELQERVSSMQRRLTLFRKRYLRVTLTVAWPADNFRDQRFRFEAERNSIRVRLLRTPRVVGQVDMRQPGFPLDQVHDWQWLEGEIASQADGHGSSRRVLLLRLHLRQDLEQELVAARAQPVAEAPSFATQYLASTEFNHDLEQLLGCLVSKEAEK